jgi:hypothetical protein
MPARVRQAAPIQKAKMATCLSKPPSRRCPVSGFRLHLLLNSRFYSVLLGYGLGVPISPFFSFRFFTTFYVATLSGFSLLPYLPFPEKAVTPLQVLSIKHLTRYMTRYNPSFKAVTTTDDPFDRQNLPVLDAQHAFYFLMATVADRGDFRSRLHGGSASNKKLAEGLIRLN